MGEAGRLQGVPVETVVQHDLDVVVAGVLGEVEPERLQQPLVRSGGGVHRDELRRERGVLGLRGPGGESRDQAEEGDGRDG